MSQASFNLPTRQEEESRVAANWLRRMEQTLAAREMRILNSALEQAGISSRDFRAKQNISLAQVDQVQELLRAAIDGITLRIYRDTELLDLGLTGYAMTSSDTVGRALEIAVQYNELTTDRYELELGVEDRDAYIRQIPVFAHLQEAVDIAEEMSGLWQIVLQLVGDQIRPGDGAVHFEYPAPDYIGIYTETFNCPCHFEAARTELRFPAAWLDHPVAGADQVTAELCASMCERLLGKAGSRTSLAESVQRLLLSRPDRTVPPIEQTASLFNMSVNQFRKRLYREGTSYKQLVLDLRMAMARYYLETTALSVQEIAYQLDYSQAAPFSRAFSAYYGHPPSRIRTA